MNKLLQISLSSWLIRHHLVELHIFVDSQIVDLPTCLLVHLSNTVFTQYPPSTSCSRRVTCSSTLLHMQENPGCVLLGSFANSVKA